MRQGSSPKMYHPGCSIFDYPPDHLFVIRRQDEREDPKHHGHPRIIITPSRPTQQPSSLSGHGSGSANGSALSGMGERTRTPGRGFACSGRTAGQAGKLFSREDATAEPIFGGKLSQLDRELGEGQSGG